MRTWSPSFRPGNRGVVAEAVQSAIEKKRIPGIHWGDNICLHHVAPFNGDEAASWRDGNVSAGKRS